MSVLFNFETYKFAQMHLKKKKAFHWFYDYKGPLKTVTHVAGGQSKEEVIEINERLRAVRVRLEESYDTAKRSLITLMTKYADSKSVRNVFHRYSLLRAMIKVQIAVPCTTSLHTKWMRKDTD